jgi:hypothetical protein
MYHQCYDHGLFFVKNYQTRQKNCKRKSTFRFEATIQLTLLGDLRLIYPTFCLSLSTPLFQQILPLQPGVRTIMFLIENPGETRLRA